MSTAVRPAVRPAVRADLLSNIEAFHRREVVLLREQEVIRERKAVATDVTTTTSLLRWRPENPNWTNTRQKLKDLTNTVAFRIEVCAAHVERGLNLVGGRRVWYINAPAQGNGNGKSNGGNGNKFWASKLPTPTTKYIVSAHPSVTALHSVRYYSNIKEERRTAFKASLDFVSSVDYDRLKFASNIVWFKSKRRIGPRCNSCASAFVWRSYRTGYVKYIGQKLSSVSTPPISLYNEAALDAWNDFFRHL